MGLDTVFSGAIAGAFLLGFVGHGITAPARSRGAGARNASPSLFFELNGGKVELEKFSGADVNACKAVRSNRSQILGKRLFDIAAAIALLVLFAPLLALTAILIRIDSRGPALYKQKRVGIDGEVFEILKFRSMREDAEAGGAKWAAADDDRVTRIGRFIRKTRIDEIPQAVNVLLGEMSFVGPRPERPEFTEILEQEIPNYHMRHVVKPGITGWAQVKFVYGASVEDAREKLKYDLYYIRHYNLLRDVLIVLMTVRVALIGIAVLAAANVFSR